MQTDNMIHTHPHPLPFSFVHDRLLLLFEASPERRAVRKMTSGVLTSLNLSGNGAVRKTMHSQNPLNDFIWSYSPVKPPTACLRLAKRLPGWVPLWHCEYLFSGSFAPQASKAFLFCLCYDFTLHTLTVENYIQINGGVM